MTANEMEALFRLKYDGLYEFVAPDISQDSISSLLTEAQLNIFMSKYNPLADKYRKGFDGSEQRRRDLERLIRHVYILPDPSGSYTLSILEASNIINIADTTGIYGSSLLTVGDKLDVQLSQSFYGSIGGTPNVPKIVKFLSNSQIQVDLVATNGGSTIGAPILRTPDRNDDSHTNGVMLLMPKLFLYAIDEGAKLSLDGESISGEAIVLPVTDDEYSANISNPYKKPYSKKIWRMDNSKVSDYSDNIRAELIIPDGYNLVYYRLRYLSMPPSIVCGNSSVDCILNETLHYEIVKDAVAMASAINKQENYQINMNELNRS